MSYLIFSRPASFHSERRARSILGALRVDRFRFLLPLPASRFLFIRFLFTRFLFARLLAAPFFKDLTNVDRPFLEICQNRWP